MELFVLGTSHSVAPGPVRERLHVEPERVRETLARLVEPERLLDEAGALVTCARYEIYGVSAHPTRARRLLGRLMSRETGLRPDELDSYAYFHVGGAAVGHLFRVAAGLDSAVQGEAQVLGQVREVASSPEATAVMGPILSRLFQSAVACGKRVRSETEIGRGAASLASASLALIQRRAGGLEGRTALVLGAGETGTLVARLLRKAGVGQLRIANRTLARAREVASTLGGTAHTLGELADLLNEADVVVGAATAPEYLLTPDLLAATGGHTPGGDRTRYLLDLAHPRNFDPAVASMPGVDLLDLEVVHQRALAARQARAEQVPRAEALVGEELERFTRWMQSRQSLPLVRAVREQVLTLAQREADRQGRGLEPRQQEALRRLARGLARTLLHQPTTALRDADPDTPEGRQLLATAETLFGVNGREGA